MGLAGAAGAAVGSGWGRASAGRHLSHSGRSRAVFAESEDQAHLVEAIDAVLRRLGGTAKRWRFDRMGTVVEIGTHRLLTSFAQVAKY